MRLSKELIMNPAYRRKTRQIRIVELCCLFLSTISFAVLVALLSIRL
jgi:hypothetical protein